MWSLEREKAKSGHLEQTWELSGKTAFCMKCLGGRRFEKKEKESAIPTGESRDTATSNIPLCKIKQNLPSESYY